MANEKRQTGRVDLKKLGARATRLMQTQPSSYDEAAHTVEMIMATGAPVRRFFGVEQMAIRDDAVVLDRLRTSGIPFLDSHMTYGVASVIGRVEDVWFEGGALCGRVRFSETDAGRAAEGMVQRGEVSGVSIGYSVEEWEITDADGAVKDPDTDRISWDDELTFTAVRWELLELSLVSIPADPQASIRALGDLRATALGREAREITVRRGDCAITYRYDAHGIQKRAEPEPKGEKAMKGKRADDDEDKKKLAAEKEAERKRKSRESDDSDDQEERDDDSDDEEERDDDTEKDDAGDDSEKDDAGDDADGKKAKDRKRAALPPLSRKQLANLVRIGDQARKLGVKIDVADAIERGVTPDALRKRAFESLAQASRDKGPKGSASPGDTAVSVQRDEREGVAFAMEVALTTRILASRGRDGVEYAPKNKDEARQVETARDQARQYMGMGFIEIAAECIGHRGHIRSFHAAEQVFKRAFESTSDFPAIFLNVLNKSLLARYELKTPTYRLISAERPFRDFRPHPQVRAGDFPALQPVTQTGELKAGISQDNYENVSVTPYGVIFPISRQMVVNDELGAIDQILGSAGDTVLVFENTTFFKMFNNNPTLTQDATAVFASGHNNLASAGADPSIQTVGNARAAMRAQKSLSGLFINVPPSLILTGPAQETNADQMIADIVPTAVANYNPFSGKLKSVSDANITDNSWYLAAEPGSVPCFVYGFLNGANGPRVRTHDPFGLQGVQMSLEHDFGTGAIDFRGFYKTPAH